MRIEGANMNNMSGGIGNGMQSAVMQRDITQMGLSQKTDSTSRTIQNQIQNKQQELQKLSENKDMSLEDKMKKRQEIQQQISELNSQLRQHQIQQRREQQQSKGNAADDMLGGKSDRLKSKSGHNAGLSQAGMKAMISADASMKQAQTQGSIATQLEGRAGVLEAEIKQDGARGGSVEKKEAELADTLTKVSDVTASQMHALNDANEAVKEAQDAESENNKANNSEEFSKKKADSDQKEAADAAVQTEKNSIALPGYYTPIDVCL